MKSQRMKKKQVEYVITLLGTKGAPVSLSDQKLFSFEIFFKQKPKQHLLSSLSVLDICLIQKPDKKRIQRKTSADQQKTTWVLVCQPQYACSSLGFGFAESMGKYSVPISPWKNKVKAEDSHIYSFIFYPHNCSILILSLWVYLELQAFIARNEQSNSVYIKVTWKLPQWLSSSFELQKMQLFHVWWGFDLCIQTFHLFIQTFLCDLKLTSQNSAKISFILVFLIHP